MGIKKFSIVFMISIIVGLILILSSITLAQEVDYVDQFGAFNYKYPIELPPGTNGMAPKLELVYNSNSGNGMLGMGWSLVGLPVICRDPSYGIYYDDRDHYIYNGEKLIPDNDGYYHTERESFIRIEAFNLNSPSSYWIVTLKNGTKMYFGSSTDSHIDAVGKGGKAYLWALKKVVDVHGNYYEVEYHEDVDNGDYYPIRITYTKNDAHPLQAYRTVEFSYEDRTDHGPMYHFSAKMDMDKRLKWITVKVGENLLRKYRLDYEYGSSTGRSRMVAVQEYGCDGNAPSAWVDWNYDASGKILTASNFIWQEGNCIFNNAKSWGSNGADFPERYRLGDFNGDGKLDLMSIEYYNGRGNFYVWLNNGTSFGSYQLWGTNGHANLKRYQLDDFNGDGKTDIIAFEGNKYFYVWLSNGTSFDNPQVWGSNGADLPDRYRLCDFNGDGKTDVLSIEKVNGRNNFYVWLSNGTSFNNYQLWGNNSEIALNRYQFGDFNGDGKKDIISFESNNTFYVWLSNGTSFNNCIPWGSNGADFPERYKLGDFNGDGKEDLISFEPNKNFYVWESAGPVSDLIKIISLSTGSNTVVSYTPAPKVLDAIKPIAKNYPDISNINLRLLATKVVIDNGLTGDFKKTISKSYKFSDGIIHLGLLHERVNLGFEWIEKTDEATGSSVKTYYYQDDIDLRGLIKKEETYGSDRKLYQVKEYRYAKELIMDNSSSPEWHDVKFIYKTDDYLYNYNGEESAPVEYRIEYRYDTFQGDLVETINHGDTATASDDQRTVTEYITNSTDHVTLPSVVRKYAVGLDGSEGLAAETRFTYTNYLLTQKEFENGSRDVTQVYGYDDYGNLIAETDGNGNTGTITYDNIYHTFVRKVTNALGHTKETVYDHLMRPVKTIDANGAVWETVYDEFSREKATIAPGDDVTNPTTRKTYPDEFINDQTGEPLFPRRMKTELKESGSDYLVKYEYYDGLGRVIQQKTEAEDGWITIDRYYDNSGREYRVSVPYLTATFEYTTPDDTVKYSLIEFDPIGRKKAVHNTDGTITRKVYGKLETLTIDPKGHVTGRRVNGNTEYQTSYTNVYPYHAEYATTTTEKAWDGIRITDALGNVLETRLDKLGRKVSYRDPDMGLWTYDYDANSNLISQTDTKGQTALIEYDAVNRLVKKEYPDGSMVRFYYDEDGHGSAKGRLTRVVYPDGAESFNYDARGRQISITQTIDGHSRAQSMTYDSMDRVVTTTYPDGEVVQSGYNRGGNLNNLSGDLTYVYGIDYSPYGKISKIQYGNGVQAVYNYYDQAGEYDNSAGTYHSYRLKQIQVSKDGGDIFNLGYEYDQAGNVKVKRDLNYSSFTEEYSYDDLNRLIGSGSPAYGYSLYRYDEINNIREKDLRTYQYSGSQPHAVTDDGRYIYTYDANGNMIGRSDGRVIEWDYENRIKSISDSGTFAYDPSGRRIKKSENGVTTYYFFATYEEEYQNGSKIKSVKFYYAGDQRVAEYSDVEGLRYYHQDHLGSSVALTDITGALIFRANYAPYGSDAYTQGLTSIKYKFTGQEKDGSGLYYYGARYYDPELGRFISPDVNLDGLNRYTYCHNNPVIYNDPTGEWAWIVGAIIGAVTGHEVAESKGIDVGSSDWWKHVITGAVIGGVAGGVGEAVFDGYMAGGEIISRNMLPAAAEYFGGTAGQYLNALYQKEIAVALGLGGCTSSFITGFGNSYAFGGEGTDLFRGDIGCSLENGLYSAFYGFAIGYGIGHLNPELFKETYDNTKIPLNISGQVHKIPLKSLYNFKYGKWLNVGRDSITKFIYSTSYQSCTILNLYIISKDYTDSERSLSWNRNLAIAKLCYPIVWDKNKKREIRYADFERMDFSFDYIFNF